MVASKARLFNDHEMLDQISLAPNSMTAKALSRQPKNYDDAVWNANARRLVTEGNMAKFSQNKAIGDFLLSTGDTVLVESCLRDCIWGIGLGQDSPEAQNPVTWRGQNLLGFTLMDVRERLR